MEVRNCRKCRRLFNYLGGLNICPVCKDALEKSFLDVRDYIRDNPSNSLQEIADGTGEDIQQIRDWIREGRLELSKGSPISLKCEKCGEVIYKGRFCDKCNESLANNLNALVSESQKPAPAPSSSESSGPRMRFKKA